MELNAYMEQGIRSISSTVSAFYRASPKGLRFLAGFLPGLRAASGRRAEREAQGLHVPPFLIASIASACNLRCAGCYARADGMCADRGAEDDLTASDWAQIFEEAETLGVCFILLAGGEPLLRRDVLTAAAGFRRIAFPVFTNGLLLDETYLSLFDENRNLVPVLSLEGSAAQTDARRGAGVSRRLDAAMEQLRARNILFAVSITVTRENVRAAVSEAYLTDLRRRGCGILFYVEYVPFQADTEHLVLDPESLRWMAEQIGLLKRRKTDMTLLSFPGDERQMGGCLAAGRGFFHISPSGAAQPCPFSPFSKLNVQTSGLERVLRSPFFHQVREISAADAGHDGGCTLFLHEKEVRAL